MIKDYFKLAIENISQRKVRSWLTIIGIVIGIAAVVALISLGQGVREAINDQFAKIGTDKIFIMPGSGFGGGGASNNDLLTENDLKAVKRVLGVSEAGSLFFKYAKFEFKKNTYFSMVFGIPTDETSKLIIESYDIQITKGRLLKSGDNYKAIVGYEVSKGKIFDKPVFVGDKIKIEGRDFEVVGLIKQTGDPDMDSSIMIPKDIAQELFDSKEESMILVRVVAGKDAEMVAENIKKELRRERGLKEGFENFQVQTSTELIESFNTIITALSAIIVSIAAISLFVGGVGIMNTMYTAVLQRTNEIGTMKAIGATNNQILTLFLIESGMLGLLGGIIGVIVGFILSKIIEFIGRVAFDSILFQAVFPWYLLVGALLFAFIVGTLSGLLPARQASNLKPVEALRYE